MKTSEAEKKEGSKKDGKKEKEPPIKFVPSKKSKVEHIFTTPTKPGSTSDGSARTLSSKEKAEMHLRSLGNILQDTDEDSESVDATDMEEFLNGIRKRGQEEKAESNQGEDAEAGDSENGEESEEEGEDEADKLPTEKTGVEDETSDEDEDAKGEEDNEEVEESDGEEDEQQQSESNDDEMSSEGNCSGDEGEEEEEGSGDDPTVQPAQPEAAATPAADQHALVPITKATSEAIDVVRNSSTNKREWDAYCRQLKANSKIPCQLSEYAQASASQKTDLFGMWLDAKRDWTKCQLLPERKVKQENEAERGWCAVQGRDLKAKYQSTPEKAEKLMSTRKSQGLWYADDDFPDDDDESRLLLDCLVFTSTNIPYMDCIPSSMPKKLDAHIIYPGFKQARYANLCNDLSLLGAR